MLASIWLRGTRRTSERTPLNNLTRFRQCNRSIVTFRFTAVLITCSTLLDGTGLLISSICNDNKLHVYFISKFSSYMETISSIQGKRKSGNNPIAFQHNSSRYYQLLCQLLPVVCGKGCVYTFALREHQRAKHALCESRHTTPPPNLCHRCHFIYFAEHKLVIFIRR